MGGKEFTDENEFDEHPDRDEGYDRDGQWYCPDCREDNKCEECGSVGESNVLHSYGCVLLCEGCSMMDGEPRCPQKHNEDDCDWCVAKWKEILGEDESDISDEVSDEEDAVKCVLCNTFMLGGYGHNPAPLADHGSCCNKCNARVVVARILSS